MKIYAVVEGHVCEKLVYACWAPLVNPALRVIQSIDDVCDNCLYIVAGGGYPSYFDVIRNGAEDVAGNLGFDRLVVAIDSEEMTFEDKFREVTQYIESLNLDIDYRAVVQHFCLETWALGNRRIAPRFPANERVRHYRETFDVTMNDPELLPDYPEEQLNRAQFAERYLRALLNERHRNASYSKRNPTSLLNAEYLLQVRRRLQDTAHIQSFSTFLDAFSV